MLEERNWLKDLALSIATCGVYATWIWFCQFRAIDKISSSKNPDEKLKDKLLPFIIFFVLELCTGTLYGFILMIMYRKKHIQLCDSYNIKTRPRSGFIYALLMYIPFFSFYLDAKEYNKLIREYNKSLSVSVN